jgi:hypothetical protein
VPRVSVWASIACKRVPSSAVIMAHLVPGLGDSITLFEHCHVLFESWSQ